MFLDVILKLDNEGNFEAALLKFIAGQAVDRKIQEKIQDPYLLNNLCWWGSILRHEVEVKDVCEKQ